MAFKYPNATRTLRFISCGSVNYEPFLFKELANIYGRSVWVCVICTLILLALTISVARQGSFLRNILDILKVIIDQEDHFNEPSSEKCPNLLC